MPHPLDRYAPYTDIEALKTSMGKPLRKCVRVNTLKCFVEQFASWAKGRGWALTQVPWCREGFFLEREDHSRALGKDLRHLLGHFYMQEAASMLPPSLLDPRPGETILDLCAAPGSKTTQMVAAMDGRGTVIANDVQENRLWTLKNALYRSGVTNCIVLKKVGQWYGKNMTERFDRVLCDAPCTAQGTARKGSDALAYCSDRSIAACARLQMELLEAAVHACKVGGRIVYSTCTMTVEENEKLVLDTLNKFSDQIEVVHPKDALPSGLQWDMSMAISDAKKVQKFLNPSLEVFHPFLRLWPQTYDTEGFFAAVLQKTASTRDPLSVPPVPKEEQTLRNHEMTHIMEWLKETYGTTFTGEGDTLVRRGEAILLVTADTWNLPLPVRDYSLGLPFCKDLGDGRYRLHSELVTARGNFATKNVWRIDDDTLQSLERGRDVPCPAELLGDVILVWNDLPLGMGLAREGTLKNRLSRWLVQHA
ncbi:MAG: NOL1/NOP2/sun family putative RNA methylase [Candidatus Peribacteraceae bacterium]|nr:NOL1/NOP2/sun family putative RNA methylase [Candidatus Peribacteraceae bacterium]